MHRNDRIKWNQKYIRCKFLNELILYRGYLPPGFHVSKSLYNCLCTFWKIELCEVIKYDIIGVAGHLPTGLLPPIFLTYSLQKNLS